MKSEPVELVLSNKKFRIVQHFYNSRNIGESWYRVFKRLAMGWMLTDYRYAHYLDSLWDEDKFLSVEETNKFLQAIGLVDENGNIIVDKDGITITEENSND